MILNLESHHVSSHETEKPPDIQKEYKIAKIMLSNEIFDNPIYDNIKDDISINSFEDLAISFQNNFEAIKELLYQTTSDRNIYTKQNKINTHKINNNDYPTLNNSKPNNQTDLPLNYNEIIKNQRYISTDEPKRIYKRKLIPMKDKELDEFLDGSLKSSKISINHSHNSIRYFEFSKAGKRNITQLRSFLISQDINLADIINMKIISDTIVEISMRKINSSEIIGKICKHLKLLNSYQPENIIHCETTAEMQANVPIDLSDYKDHILSTIIKLEKLNIKLNYTKFLNILLSKIDSVIVSNLKNTSNIERNSDNIEDTNMDITSKVIKRPHETKENSDGIKSKNDKHPNTRSNIKKPNKGSNSKSDIDEPDTLSEYATSSRDHSSGEERSKFRRSEKKY